jgi:hypothetical protein
MLHLQPATFSLSLGLLLHGEESATVANTVGQTISALKNQQFHCRAHKSSSLNPIPSQLHPIYTNMYVRLNLILSCVTQWLKTGFGLVVGFIGYLQVVTTNNYDTIADLKNLQPLHANLLSLSALVLTDL